MKALTLLLSFLATSLLCMAQTLLPGSIGVANASLNYNKTAQLTNVQYPSGCSGAFTFQWQQSTDGTNYTNIAGGTSSFCVSGRLTNPLTYFRRMVYCGANSSASNAITVAVSPAIFPGQITPLSISIPSGSDAGIISVNAAKGGSCNGAFLYQWQTANDGVNFTDVPGETNLNYWPKNITSNAYYRMQVRCGSDTAFSDISLISVGTSGKSLNSRTEKTILKPGVTDKTTASQLTSPYDVMVTTQYADGLGRVIQTVKKQQSPAQKDLVNLFVYDQLGRESVKYPVFASDNSDGSFKQNGLQQLSNSYSSLFTDQHFFYTRDEYENSSLNRVLSNSATGDDWVGQNNGVHGRYLFNSASDSVVIWSIDTLIGSIPVNGGYYAPGQLTRTYKTDEMGKPVVEYNDKQGNLILKKTAVWSIPAAGHSGWICTYNIYDDLQNLRFVIQPRAVEWLTANGWNFASSGGSLIAYEFCYRYEYDRRNRVIIKKLPGAGETWMVYDARDRLIMTQDSVARAGGYWVVTKYDDLNRKDTTGVLTDGNNRTYHQNLAYSSTTYPATGGSNFEFFTITFYDDNNWVSGVTSRVGATLSTKYTTNPNYFITSYNTAPYYAQPITTATSSRGLVTGTIVKAIHSGAFYFFTANFYDDHERLIQKESNNYSWGVDTTTTQYDFSGKPLRIFTTHLDANTPAQYHTELSKMNYDAGLRLTSILKNMDNAPADQLIDSIRYDELGQLRVKYLGNFLDSMVYDYNIRGWMTGINKNYIAGTASHYFGTELGYDKPASAAAGTSFQGLQLNGNVAGIVWKSAGDGINRKYDFTYDNINRLAGAAFNQNSSGSSWDHSKIDFSVSGLSYDANGNILSMNQNGFKLGGSVPIDQLTYGYVINSNRLNTVNDASNDTASRLGDFYYKGTKTGQDYKYNGNGSLATDNNKNISYISYTFLNQPESISFKGKGLIQFTYDANGNKIRKIAWDSTTRHTTVTLYLGNFIYQKTDSFVSNPNARDTLQLAIHEEGRTRYALHHYTNGTTGYGWEYDFFEKDHLSNTRVVLTGQKDTARYIATMEAAYRATENALFYNIPATSVARATAAGYPVELGTTNPNDSVARLNGSGQKVGPAIILKVMSGDIVKIATNYYFNSSAATNGQYLAPTDIINSLANGIVSLTGGAHGSFADLTGPSTPLTAALTSFINTQNGNASGKPNAYLNWILLDNQFNYISTNGQSGAMQVANAGTAGGSIQPPLGNTISITTSGYLYIYVSNATPSWDVYFDNLGVQHFTGPMLEENHYYPFGLTMAGISDKALKPNYAENKYRYAGKELENHEFNDGSGLEEYDYGKRMQDPQLGRWWTLDPKADLLEMSSPYAFCYNNPVNYKDPNGDLAILINGRVFEGDDERPVNGHPGKVAYWDQGIIDAIKNSGVPNSSNMFFVDGDRWGQYTWDNDPKNVHFEMHNATFATGNDPEGRRLAGREAAVADWESIISRLKKDPNSKKIVEKIEIFTHSRGAAFGAGYIDELLYLIEQHADLFADAKNEIDAVFNMAPHQSWDIKEPGNLFAFSSSHTWDVLSGNLMGGLMAAFSSNENSPGAFGSHSTSSFVKDVNAFLKAFLQSKGDKNKLIQNFIALMQQYGVKVTFL
ncbi:MAG TPA: DUF6443 domain-containing protein [Puia sp.]|nr:DUF6443 domain-containing protein [Puia sp.]